MCKSPRTIWSRGSVASTAHVIQYERLLTRHITVDETLLVMVSQGQKNIEWQDRNISLTAGEAVLVSAGCTFDVANIPHSSHVPFEAEWLSFPALKLCEPADTLHPEMPRVLRGLSCAFRQAFCHTITAIKNVADIPENVAIKRVEEMREWLESFGLALRPGVKEMLSQRVRKLVATNLLYPWTTQEVACHFAMSEATFRRRLHAENTTFRHLFTEARMCHALTLLQVTDQTVSRIALEVGYENASKFTARFRARFGFNPGQFRAQEVQAGSTVYA